MTAPDGSPSAADRAVSQRPRVLVLGDYHYHRIHEPLAGAATQVTVLSRRPPEDPLHRAATDWRVVDFPLPADLIRSTVAELGIDVVIPRTRGTENEEDIVAYAQLAATSSPGPYWAVHSPEFAETVIGKTAFFTFAVEAGIPTPPGHVCTTLAEGCDAAARLGGFPVVTKQDRAAANDGTKLASCHEDLEAVFHRAAGRPVLIQQLLAGEELGVEVVTGPAGSVRFPVVSMGPLDSDLYPIGRVRTGPKRLPGHLQDRLDELLTVIERELSPRGPWQVDFAVCDDELWFFEVNPRLGGLSDLSRLITGTDPHAVSCATACGLSTVRPTAGAVALEIPVGIASLDLDIRTPSLTAYVQPARTHRNWRLVISSGSVPQVMDVLNRVPDDALCVDRAHVESRIKEAFC